MGTTTNPSKRTQRASWVVTNSSLVSLLLLGLALTTGCGQIDDPADADSLGEHTLFNLEEYALEAGDQEPEEGGEAAAENDDDSQSTVEEDEDEPVRIPGVCVAKVVLTRAPNWPGYIDSKSASVVAKGRDGNTVGPIPCTFDLSVFIAPDNVFGPQFMVGLIFKGMILFQTPNGMTGKWKNAPLACGEKVAFDIMSFQAGPGLSKLASVVFECGDGKGPGGVVH